MNQLEYRRSIQVAHNFLTRCFAPGEFIAFLLRSEHPVTVMQRVVLLERAVAPRYLGWLAHQNAAGANSYFAANPLRFGIRRRTKESVFSVRQVYLDIDSEGGPSSLHSRTQIEFRSRPLSSLRRPTNIRSSGVWKALTLPGKKAP